MSLLITTPPTAEPVTEQEVLDRLRLKTPSDGDSRLIASAISTAREYAESVTGWSLAAKTYADVRDNFPYPPRTPLVLFRPPLVAVTAIKFLDGSYAWQTWDPSEYWVADGNIPALVQPKEGIAYPFPCRAPGSVRIEFEAGASTYGPHLEGVRQLAVHIFEHPEAIASGDLKEVPLSISTFFKVKRAHCYF